MNKKRLPKIDSLRRLAKFWDTHDSTDFEDELEEVADSVFVRSVPVRICLDAEKADAVRALAQAKGTTREALIESWVAQKLTSRRKPRKPKKPTKR